MQEGQYLPGLFLTISDPNSLQCLLEGEQALCADPAIRDESVIAKAIGTRLLLFCTKHLNMQSHTLFVKFCDSLLTVLQPSLL